MKLLWMLALSGLVFAECGSGITDEMVPDGFMGASYRGACEKHDRCYSICNISKYSCDNEFYEDLKSACYESYDGRFSVTKIKVCKEVARNYYRVVRDYGNYSFEDNQDYCTDDESLHFEFRFLKT